MKYESRHASHVFHFSHGYFYLTSFPYFIPRFRIEILVIWHIITSLALWTIWKMRCDVVFNTAHIHLRTVFIEFWLLFVHTLRGQYNDLQGLVDALRQRQMDFKKRWRGLYLFLDTTSRMRWNYAIPSFLLPCL